MRAMRNRRQRNARVVTRWAQTVLVNDQDVIVADLSFGAGMSVTG